MSAKPHTKQVPPYGGNGGGHPDFSSAHGDDAIDPPSLRHSNNDKCVW